MKECGNRRKCCSTTTSRNVTCGHNDSFDDTIVEHNEVHNQRRNMLHVVDPDKEEKEYDHVLEER